MVQSSTLQNTNHLSREYPSFPTFLHPTNMSFVETKQRHLHYDLPPVLLMRTWKGKSSNFLKNDFKSRESGGRISVALFDTPNTENVSLRPPRQQWRASLSLSQQLTISRYTLPKVQLHTVLLLNETWMILWSVFNTELSNIALPSFHVFNKPRAFEATWRDHCEWQNHRPPICIFNNGNETSLQCTTTTTTAANIQPP